ncbi:MAG: threonine-phosphate decarboxylase CobD [Candidatus Omnitrophota bacterium]|nr:threonine-phosphate decarboxylase CobD [Candidatus Omnitrophota bacterium]
MSKSFSHGGNIEEVAREFRIREDSIIDFSSNVNPFSLPQSVSGIIRSNIPKIQRYPDRESLALKKTLGKYLNIDAGHIVIGNGSVDIIYRAVNVLKPKSGFILLPAFGEYERALVGTGVKVKYLFSQEKDNFGCSIGEIIRKADGADILFLCNPNNPTGRLIPRKELRFLAERLRRKETVLILDEAFIDLAQEHSLVDVAVKNNNLLVLRSMTKFFGLAGLRLGYGVGGVKLIRRIEDYGQPWPVNVFAQSAGEAIIKDKEFKKETRRKLLEERDFLYQRLCRINGLKPFQSSANFMLVKIVWRLSSCRLQRRLVKRGLLVRDCSNFRGLNNRYIRIAVRKHKDNLRLIRELETIFCKGNNR